MRNGDYLPRLRFGNFTQRLAFGWCCPAMWVDHISPKMTFRQMWERQLRWAMEPVIRAPEATLGGTHFRSPLRHPGPDWCLLPGPPVLGIALFVLSLLNRIAQCWIVGWMAVHDPVARWWVLPIRCGTFTALSSGAPATCAGVPCGEAIITSCSKGADWFPARQWFCGHPW